MAIHAQKSITCCVKSLKLLTRKYFPSHNRKFHFVGKMMVYALWHRQLDDKGRGTEFKVELRQTLAKELFRRLFDANVGIKALSQLAHYFCTDPNWMWESSYMIHRVYTAALATNDTQIVTFWLSYLFKKSSPVAVQCLADVLNACFTTGDIDMCCQALRKAVNAHKNLNTFYCDLAARMPHFADFPWQCIALRDFHLVERIRCDMAANPKSANVLALFDHAMSKGRGNYYVSSFVI